MSVASALGDVFVRSGKVRDLYRLPDDRLLLVASDRISAFDVVLPTADPGQGQGADRPVALLVRPDGRASSPTTCSARDPATLPEPFAGAADELRGRVMICRTRRRAAGRDHRARLPVGQRLEGLPAHRRGVAASRCRPACASPTGCPSRSSRRRPRPTVGPRREHRLRHDGRAGRAADWPSRCATSALALYAFAARPRRAVRASSWPTPSSSSASTRERRAAADRRGADARLVALLGRRRRTSRAGPRPSLRQAVRARLAGDARLGQDAARAGAAGRRRRRHARALRRGVRAHHRRQPRPLPRRGRHCLTYRFAVDVMPQAGHPRPAGPGGRAEPAATSTSTACSDVRSRPAGRADRGRRRRGRGASKSSAGWPKSCCATRWSRRTRLERLA